MLADEFRVNHRAASECLLRASDDHASHEDINEELNRAEYFEDEAMKHVTTPRQRALGMALCHGVDLMRAVAMAEFHTP